MRTEKPVSEHEKISFPTSNSPFSSTFGQFVEGGFSTGVIV